MASLDAQNIENEVAADFVVENNTLARAVKEDPKDTIAIEVGDSKQPDFKPQVKIMRWDNEVNFSIRAQEDPNATASFDGKKAIYAAPDYEVHMYEQPDASEDGGFEFEWILKSKPKSNVLVATTQFKGIVGIKQLPLNQVEREPEWVDATETQAFDKDGNVIAERPENIVNSLAFYHESKGGMNDAAGMDYKVGKIGHSFRIKATDAKGNWVWGDQEWDSEKNEFHAIVPQDFLDSAAYPVVVDPTFGYTTAGASKTNITLAFMRAGSNGVIGSSGTVTDVNIYTDGAASASFGVGVYTSATSILTPQANNGTAPTTQQWNQLSISSGPSVTSGTNYYAATIIDSSIFHQMNLHFDTVGSGADGIGNNNAGTFPTWPTSGNFTGSTTNYSIYANYTTSGGTLTPSVSDSITVSENTSLTEIFLINVSDSVTVSENIQVSAFYPISVSDSITVSENVSFFIPLPASVNDTITVSESITPVVVSFISVSDSITVSESIVPNLVSIVNVFESVVAIDNPEAFLTNGLQGYWTLDAKDTNFGTNTTNDISGNGNNGTLLSMTSANQVPGQLYEAFSFSGTTGQYVDVGTALDFSSGKEFSVSFWVKASATQTAGFLCRGTGNGGEQYCFDISSVPKVFRFFTRNSAAAVNGNISAATGPNTSTWTHVVGTFSGSGLVQKLYVNGTQAATTAVTNSLLAGSHITSIGNRQSASGTYDQPLNGNLDDVRIYSRALSATEVSQLFAMSANNPNIVIVELPVVSETVTVSESVTILIPTLFVNVSDSITVSESPQIIEVDLISVSDSITVSESVSISIGSGGVSVSDNVTVSENVTIVEIDTLSVSDSVALSEAVTPTLVSIVNVADSVSAIDTPQSLLIIDLPTVSDSVTVSENVSFFIPLSLSVSDSVTVSEFVAISVIGGGALTQSVSDTVTVSESVSLRIDLNPSVADVVTVSESVSLSLPVNDSIFDLVTVSESVSFFIPLKPSVSDSVTVFESFTPTLVLVPSVSQSVTVSENISFVISTALQISDAVSVSESVSFSIKVQFSVADSITVSESFTILETKHPVVVKANVIVNLGWSQAGRGIKYNRGKSAI